MQKAARIALMALVIAASAASVVVLANQSVRSAPADTPGSAAEQRCVPIDRYKFVGPALTVAEVEGASLEAMKKVPGTPLVPFGYNHSQWVKLKATIRTGDELHAFETDKTGGYLLLRGKCVVDQMVNWIR